jgi:hypothetical protein
MLKVKEIVMEPLAKDLNEELVSQFGSSLSTTPYEVADK